MMIEKSEQKVYGLSFPTRVTKEKPKTLVESVFAAESDEEPDTVQLKPLKVQPNAQTGHAKLHRKTKSDYEKAMEEDPSVFQYDEIYDDIRSEKDRQVKDILGGAKKEAKYVGRLLKTAEERKLERELCMERKAQKEIEAEAELYGDKESFVTSAYKDRLTQLRELVSKREEEQVREDYMDITKQQGLGGFYRYMYQHGMKSEATETPTTSASSRTDDTHKEQQPSEARIKVEPMDEERKHDDSSDKHRSSRHDKVTSERSARSHRSSPKAASHSRDHAEKSSKESHSYSRHSPDSRYENDSRRERDYGDRGRRRSPTQHQSSDKQVDSNKPSEKSQRIPSSESTSRSIETKSNRSADSAERPQSGAQPAPRKASDPNYIYARPRVTTDAEIEEARQRYLARKAAGIHPVIADSDSD